VYQAALLSALRLYFPFKAFSQVLRITYHSDNFSIAAVAYRRLSELRRAPLTLWFGNMRCRKV
jgi:hypothetical protein